MKRAVLIGAAVAVLGIAGLALGKGAGDAARVMLKAGDPDAVALGADVYGAQCASCHGAELEGQPDWRIPGVNGRLPAPPHDATGHTWHHDGDTLFRITKYGLAEMIGNPDYETDMPAYRDKLTDSEIVAVLSYIKSTWPEDIRARHDDMETLK